MNLNFLRISLLMTLINFLSSPSYAKTETINNDKADLQLALDQAAKDQLVPGALAYIQSPKDKIVVPYGTTSIDLNKTPSVRDYFRIGSNTKSMISAVIVQLAQEKLIDLKDPVSKYIEGVPNGYNITIDLLMKNRSGLYNYLESPKFAKAFDINPLKVWTPSELLGLAFENPVQFAPNARFDYCNTNFILLGLIAEKIDKKPLYKIFKDRLFIPLNMKHTYLPNDSDNTLPEPYSHGYAYGKSAHVLTHKVYSAKMQQEIEQGKIKPKDYTIQNASWSWAAGGVVSTAEDLAIWIGGLSEGKLFNQEFYNKWLASPEWVDANNKVMKYGYGFLTLDNGTDIFYFHNGELPGFNSYMIYNLNKKQSIIIWSNLTVSKLAVPAADMMKTAIYNVLYKPNN